jgi:hypothetical protein
MYNTVHKTKSGTVQPDEDFQFLSRAANHHDALVEMLENLIKIADMKRIGSGALVSEARALIAKVKQ